MAPRHTVALFILTVEHLLLKLLHLFLGFAVGDDDAGRTGVQRRRQCNLIFLGYSDKDQCLALRVVLGGVNNAIALV